MKLNSKAVIARSLIVGLCFIFFSFSHENGGDSFEIYLNGQLVLRQYLTQVKTVQNLELVQSSANDKIDIYYSHCGQTGKGRAIAIKDEQNKLLKEWHFPDASVARSAMSCKLKDILDLEKNKNGTKLSLFYSSKELPGGRQLASIVSTKKHTAIP